MAVVSKNAPTPSFDLDISLSNGKNVSVTEALYNATIVAIAKGKFENGDKYYTYSELQEKYGIAKASIAKLMQMLTVDGYIDSVVTVGGFIDVKEADDAFKKTIKDTIFIPMAKCKSKGMKKEDVYKIVDEIWETFGD